MNVELRGTLDADDDRGIVVSAPVDEHMVADLMRPAATGEPDGSTKNTMPVRNVAPSSALERPIVPQKHLERTRFAQPRLIVRPRQDGEVVDNALFLELARQSQVGRVERVAVAGLDVQALRARSLRRFGDPRALWGRCLAKSRLNAAPRAEERRPSQGKARDQ